jgi:hypothetical protein
MMFVLCHQLISYRAFFEQQHGRYAAPSKHVVRFFILKLPSGFFFGNYATSHSLPPFHFAAPGLPWVHVRFCPPPFS